MNKITEKEIPDFPNYFVSISGDVYSKRTNKKLKPYLPKGKNYLVITLKNNKYEQPYKLSEMVLSSFIPKPSNISIPYHKNLNIHDCSLNNLEWINKKDLLNKLSVEIPPPVIKGVSFKKIPDYPYLASSDGYIWTIKSYQWKKITLFTNNKILRAILYNYYEHKNKPAHEWILSAFNIDLTNKICFFKNGNYNDLSIVNIEVIDYVDGSKIIEKLKNIDNTKEYRAVNGHPGYFISNFGDIWSIGKVGETSVSFGLKKIKPRIKHSGHLEFGISLPGDKRLRMSIHRLVLENFVGPCPINCECLHGDGNPANNHVSNLRWGTHIENCMDAMRHGTQVKGERVSTAVLTEHDVFKIRELLKTMTIKDVANIYNVTRPTIGAIKYRKTWKHI